MRFNANNLIVLSNFVCFTSCLFISSFICSSLLFETTIAVSNGLLLKDEINDFSHSSLSENNRGLWRPQQQQRLPILLSKLPVKIFKQNDRYQHWLKSHKRQMEEQPPPGFVGARGRRAKEMAAYYYNKRVPTDYQTLTETFPDLWPQLKDGESIDTITEDLMDPLLVSGKKSDNIVYKEGFLGVRG